MTKGKAKNVAASVCARLQDLGRREKEDFQLVLTRYGLERLLYPKETVVAEKCQAVVMLGMVNSRMKNFFDLPQAHGRAGSGLPVMFPLRFRDARCEDATSTAAPPRLQRCRSSSSASSHRTHAWRRRDRDR